MKRVLILLISLSLFLTLAFVTGCEKEKIVESTEIVKEVEYVTLPPDTVVQYDTVVVNDSTTVERVDTVIVHDTVTRVDTVTQTQYVHDTIVTTVYDTTVVVQNHYDTITVTVTDTVMTVQCNPDDFTAMGALQWHTDPLVMQLIQQEFGYTDGWIYYLTTNQTDYQRVSATVYDMYGYIDYWAPDWSGYYPLEYYWRMTFTGTDPSDPTHWTMSEPPTGSPAGSPGLKVSQRKSSTDIQLH